MIFVVKCPNKILNLRSQTIIKNQLYLNQNDHSFKMEKGIINKLDPYECTAIFLFIPLGGVESRRKSKLQLQQIRLLHLQKRTIYLAGL